MYIHVIPGAHNDESVRVLLRFRHYGLLVIHTYIHTYIYHLVKLYYEYMKVMTKNHF